MSTESTAPIELSPDDDVTDMLYDLGELIPVANGDYWHCEVYRAPEDLSLFLGFWLQDDWVRPNDKPPRVIVRFSENAALSTSAKSKAVDKMDAWIEAQKKLGGALELSKQHTGAPRTYSIII